MNLDKYVEDLIKYKEDWKKADNEIYTASSTSTEYQAFINKLSYTEKCRLAKLRLINGDYDN